MIGNCDHLARLVLAAMAIVLIAIVSARWATVDAAVPARERIVHQGWTFKDGAPEGVQAIAQTADGYLWLGTQFGLFRFDGRRFEVFQSAFGDRLMSTSVSASLRQSLFECA
ncbi:MAG TPA: hypothetical protein VMT89_09605 [Candidatus Acidoferrales bacterium]|nr:hypothetical protein [Candidatus Acidoferrales bacterium]